MLDNDLHCGTPLKILARAGTWLDGRYEISHTHRGTQPVLYVALGGLSRPEGQLHIPDDTLLRHPSCRR